MPAVPLLAISGEVGVGKSAVTTEIHEVLRDCEIPHACIERDTLAWSWPTHGYYNESVMVPNLASLWANFRDAGAERLVVAGVIERTADLDAYRRAVPGAEITVCRLRASQSVREARLRARELGAGIDWHLARTIELERILDEGKLDDFAVANDGPVRAVALEVLQRAGWIADGG